MNKDINTMLVDLKNKINNGEYKTESRGVREWGGADVIISSTLSKIIKEWLGDQNVVISLQKTTPKKRAVITEHSKELSWLFYELKNIFRSRIDYISKFDFYGFLAQSSLDYLENSSIDQNCEDLLLTVIGDVRRKYLK